jgi:methionyl aminopeptidase
MNDTAAGRRITLHAPGDFAGMRAAGRLAAETLDMITAWVRPGVTTAELDRLCHAFILERGGVPASLGYRGYAHATCISLNHVVCHGIPGGRVLLEGDILNIDLAVILGGWHGDSSRMYTVGRIATRAARLIEVTYEAMMRGIAAVRPGATLGDIGFAMQSHVEAARFSMVRDFCGHGLGRRYHDAPDVLNYGEPGQGRTLSAGMFLTVEPMVNAGRCDVKVLSDGWTAVTRDRSLSAQFEHSIGVTETGYEIFTLSPAGFYQPPYG